MAFTVGYALLGALAVALLLIPGLAYVIYRKPQKNISQQMAWKNKRSLWEKELKKSCKRLKGNDSRNHCLLYAGVLSYTVGKDFLLNGWRFYMAAGTITSGISLAKAKEMSDTLRARTLKHSEITYMMVQAGRNDDGTDPWTASHFEVSVGIKPYDQYGHRRKTKADLIKELAADYKEMPGFTVGFSQPMIDGVWINFRGSSER